jgi:hypothetical protein
MRPRLPELRVGTPTCGVLARPLPLRPRVQPRLPALRRVVLLLMLPVHRQLLRPLRPLLSLCILARLRLRLLRLVLGHRKYFVRRT